jgi:uncharacterized membrane protein
MGRQWSDYSKPLSTGFRVLAIFALFLGMTLRFVHLDQKIYWLDETFTSLHLFGYSDAEVIRQIGDGKFNWLRWELWRSPLTGWTAVMLVAVSPLHLATAQEARPYALLIVMILGNDSGWPCSATAS